MQEMVFANHVFAVLWLIYSLSASAVCLGIIIAAHLKKT
jgi:hypothetical protein